MSEDRMPTSGSPRFPVLIMTAACHPLWILNQGTDVVLARDTERGLRWEEVVAVDVRGEWWAVTAVQVSKPSFVGRLVGRPTRYGLQWCRIAEKASRDDVGASVLGSDVDVMCSLIQENCDVFHVAQRLFGCRNWRDMILELADMSGIDLIAADEPAGSVASLAQADDLLPDRLQDPEDFGGQDYQQARAWYDAGRFADALLRLEECARVAPHFKTFELLGECLLRLARAAEAVQPLAAACAMNRGARPRVLLARALAQIGRVSEARSWLKETLEHHPGYGPAVAALAELSA